MSEAAGDSFWRFTLAVYGRPGIAPALVELQDRHGLDVNLALFCAWLGWSGRGQATEALLDRAERAVADWRREIVEPLRAVRRALKGKREPAGASELREAVQRQEIEAERLAQRLLVSVLPSESLPTPAPMRRADVAANLTLYCNLLRIPPHDLDFIGSVLPVAGS
jgi:uncharacterized protein (TIGR02444 family)